MQVFKKLTPGHHFQLSMKVFPGFVEVFLTKGRNENKHVSSLPQCLHYRRNYSSKTRKQFFHDCPFITFLSVSFPWLWKHFFCFIKKLSVCIKQSLKPVSSHHTLPPFYEFYYISTAYCICSVQFFRTTSWLMTMAEW